MPNGEPRPIKLGEEPPVEIKVMPEQFYFKKVKIPKKAAGERPKTALIIVMIIVILALMAGAAYLFTKSLETAKPVSKPTPTPVVTPTPPANIPPVNVPPANIPPVNVSPVNVPLAPVCGNGSCETGENAINCPTDCPSPPPSPPPTVIPLARDTDNDGLTDVEEELFTTDIANLDSDSDGYRDGLEVINLYNPAGFAPHKIEETALVKIYSNPTYKYSIFYPASWLARSLDETNREAMFTSITGEFIQVIVEDNLERLPLLDWYLSKSPGTIPAEVGTATTKRDGMIGIKSPDGLTVYFAFGDKIYAISYNIGVKTELNYKSIFEMVYKSFKIGAL